MFPVNADLKLFHLNVEMLSMISCVVLNVYRQKYHVHYPKCICFSRQYQNVKGKDFSVQAMKAYGRVM